MTEERRWCVIVEKQWSHQKNKINTVGSNHRQIKTPNNACIRLFTEKSQV